MTPAKIPEWARKTLSWLETLGLILLFLHLLLFVVLALFLLGRL